MTTMTHRPQHPTEAICPPWCAGHTSPGFEGYQGWEIRTSDGGRQRDHCEVPTLIRGVGVEVCSVEDADHTLRPATVEVFVNDHDGPADLTPTEARELARLLLDRADRVEGPPVKVWLSDAWAALTWRGWPVMTRGRADRQAQAAFRLGVDAGSGGLLSDSSQPPPRVRHLSGLPSGVVGVEIPPR